jgi:drug/metabolite transporter (DMT)-like permease
VLLTLAALVAFASNSILCRLALGGGAIDPASFTTIRLVTGAAALTLIAGLRRERPAGDTLSAAALFLYAAPFSFAYLFLDAGAGALLLFGAVQATMIAAGLRAGERPHRGEWFGLAAALGGLAYLLAPGMRSPSPVGAALMIAAGVAWGVYSLRGRAVTGAVSATAATAGNFLRAAPLALLLSLALSSGARGSLRGALLAAASGAIASGAGYAIWYAALRGLTATRAATVQLAVPVLAAFGGVAFLGERVTARLAVSAMLILGGVALAIRSSARGRT